MHTHTHTHTHRYACPSPITALAVGAQHVAVGTAEGEASRGYCINNII